MLPLKENASFSDVVCSHYRFAYGIRFAGGHARPYGKGGAYGKCERPTVIHRFLNPEMKIENRLRKAAAEAVRRFSIRCRPEAFPFGEGVAAVAVTDEGET